MDTAMHCGCPVHKRSRPVCQFGLVSPAAQSIGLHSQPTPPHHLALLPSLVSVKGCINQSDLFDSWPPNVSWTVRQPEHMFYLQAVCVCLHAPSSLNQLSYIVGLIVLILLWMSGRCTTKSFPMQCSSDPALIVPGLRAGVPTTPSGIQGNYPVLTRCAFISSYR